jgi:hypothetical protein
MDMCLLQVYVNCIEPGEPGVPYCIVCVPQPFAVPMAALHHMCPLNKELSDKHESLLPGKGKVEVKCDKPAQLRFVQNKKVHASVNTVLPK